jgi:hypothetical protein
MLYKCIFLCIVLIFFSYFFFSRSYDFSTSWPKYEYKEFQLWLLILAQFFCSFIIFRIVVRYWSKFRHLLITRVTLIYSASVLVLSSLTLLTAILSLFDSKYYRIILDFEEGLSLMISVLAILSIINLLVIRKSNPSVA